MEGDVVFPPLEDRTVEIIKNGIKQKVPAFNKQFVPDFQFKSFYVPRLDSMTVDPLLFHEWEEDMGIYRDNLKWLLRLPHYKFWSTLVFSKDIVEQVLSSYLLKALRPHDPETKEYLRHPRIGPLILQIHGFIFRVFMRLSTFNECKEDHINPSKWAMLIHGRKFFDAPKLLQLCVLFGSTHKELLMRMIRNILKHEPRLLEDFSAGLPVYIEQWKKQGKELTTLVKQKNGNGQRQQWETGPYQDILKLNLEHVVSFHKFVQFYSPIAAFVHKRFDFESILAMNYDQDVQEWKKVVQHLPQLEGHVNIWRVHMLKLFRLVLTTTTILSKPTPEGSAVDEFFGVISNCLELTIFLHDYERTFPFITDINNLRRKGIHVDSTRVEYLSNAFEASFEACGQRYSSRDTGVGAWSNDPLDDPTFDRQLLGACSLDVVGPELLSLVSQVKDLLPDLPNGYIEACLKHYGYASETVINAILEGSIPTSLDKYKDPPPPKEEKAVQEIIYRKNDTTLDDSFLVPNSEVKQRVLEMYEAQENRKGVIPNGNDTGDDYLAKSLLPNFREEIEYDDEYDDTYDEAGMGMTEPDAMPLNPKLKARYQDENDEDEEPEVGKTGGFEQFVEDPAVVRARMEQRRATQYRGHDSRPQRDVIGRGKGHGQSTEVLLNRRRKDEAGSHNRRKRGDYKRREF